MLAAFVVAREITITSFISRINAQIVDRSLNTIYSLLLSSFSLLAGSKNFLRLAIFLVGCSQFPDAFSLLAGTISLELALAKRF